MLKTLHVENFMAFKKATFEFGALNIIHGDNGAGKTQLLRLAYAMTSIRAPIPLYDPPDMPVQAWLMMHLNGRLKRIFNVPNRDALIRRGAGSDDNISFGVTWSDDELLLMWSKNMKNGTFLVTVPKSWAEQRPVFIPPHEYLTYFPGFQSLSDLGYMPFDETVSDLCRALGRPSLPGPTDFNRDAWPWTGLLQEPMEGELAIENGQKFVIRTPGGDVDLSLAAEGHRKLAQIAWLIRNGSIGKGVELYWDEPEANLNPKLIRVAAQLAVDLAKGGVQVFIATHSVFLMRQIELLTADLGDSLAVRHIGLERSDDGTIVHQGPNPSDSGPVVALEESVRQSEAYLEID